MERAKKKPRIPWAINLHPPTRAELKTANYKSNASVLLPSNDTCKDFM
jgi:hypothetical protein